MVHIALLLSFLYSPATVAAVAVQNPWLNYTAPASTLTTYIVSSSSSSTSSSTSSSSGSGYIPEVQTPDNGYLQEANTVSQQSQSFTTTSSSYGTPQYSVVNYDTTSLSSLLSSTILPSASDIVTLTSTTQSSSEAFTTEDNFFSSSSSSSSNSLSFYAYTSALSSPSSYSSVSGSGSSSSFTTFTSYSSSSSSILISPEPFPSDYFPSSSTPAYQTFSPSFGVATSASSRNTIVTSAGIPQIQSQNLWAPEFLGFFQQQGSLTTWTSDGTKYVAEVFPTYTITLTTESGYSAFRYQSYSVTTEYSTSEQISYDYSFGFSTSTTTTERYHRGRWATRVTTERRTEHRHRDRRISYPPFIKTLYEDWRITRRWWRSVIEASIEHIETIMGPVSTDRQLYVTTIDVTKTFYVWLHGWGLPYVEHIPELVTYTAQAFTKYFTDGRVETFTINGVHESGWVSTLITVVDGSTITEYVSGIVTTNTAGYPMTVALTSYGKGLSDLTAPASASVLAPVTTVLSTVDQAGPYTFTTTVLTIETHLTDEDGKDVSATVYYVDTPTVTPIVQTETVTGTNTFTYTVSTEVTYTVGEDGYTTPDTIYHVEVPPTTSYEISSSSSLSSSSSSSSSFTTTTTTSSVPVSTFSDDSSVVSSTMDSLTSHHRRTDWSAIWVNPVFQLLNPPWIQIATGSGLLHISFSSTTESIPYDMVSNIPTVYGATTPGGGVEQTAYTGNATSVPSEVNHTPLAMNTSSVTDTTTSAMSSMSSMSSMSPAMNTTSTTSTTTSTTSPSSTESQSVLKMYSATAMTGVPAMNTSSTTDTTTSAMSSMSGMSSAINTAMNTTSTSTTFTTSTTTSTTSPSSTEGQSMLKMYSARAMTGVPAMNTPSSMSSMSSAVNMSGSTVSVVPVTDSGVTVSTLHRGLTTMSTGMTTSAAETSSSNASVMKLRNGAPLLSSMTTITVSTQPVSDAHEYSTATYSRESISASDVQKKGKVESTNSEPNSHVSSVTALSSSSVSNRAISSELSMSGPVYSSHSTVSLTSFNHSTVRDLTGSMQHRVGKIMHIALATSHTVGSSLASVESSTTAVHTSVSSSGPSILSGSVSVFVPPVSSTFDGAMSRAIVVSPTDSEPSVSDHVAGNVASHNSETGSTRGVSSVVTEAFESGSSRAANVQFSLERSTLSSGSGSLEETTSYPTMEEHSVSLPTSDMTISEEEVAQNVESSSVNSFTEAEHPVSVHTTPQAPNMPSNSVSVEEPLEATTPAVAVPARTYYQFTTSTLENRIQSSATMGLLTHFTGGAPSTFRAPWKLIGSLFFVMFLL